MPQQTGGPGMDVLVGRAGEDGLYGLGGADILDGGDGDDWLQGGDGSDQLIGGAGSLDYASYKSWLQGVLADLSFSTINLGAEPWAIHMLASKA